MTEIPEFLRRPHRKLTEQEQRRIDLEDQYIERFGEPEWDEFTFCPTDAEMIGALETCMKEGKRMKDVRPEWCEDVPPWIRR